MEPQAGQGPEARNNPVENREGRKESQEGRARDAPWSRMKGQVDAHDPGSENPMSKHSYAGSSLL